MNNWFDRLHNALEARGWNPVILTTPTGRLLITEYNARLFALELNNTGSNLLYHDPAHEDPDSGAGLLGGDRLWIAPEVAYYWPTLEHAREDANKYAAPPPSVDPGSYTTTDVSATHTAYTARVTLTDSRVDKSIDFTVNRLFRTAETLTGLPPEVTCMSFALENRITLNAGDPGAIAGAWSICQLPAGGTLHCPTIHRPNHVTSYYEPFRDRVEITDRGVRFRIDGKAKTKLGLTATDSNGRMGYYRENGAAATLLLRAFPVLPGEPYVDVPIDADKNARRGTDVFQAYNHSEGPDTFGEMEYHDPALVVGQQPETRSGTSITHALSGPSESLREIGRDFLGMPVQRM
ncbi:DUF6786 family protein [Mucisphaera calidilacus]|uniref:Uncharacterized protein n=1 Tax=Mucisphaera calidilacus TaxID=2527982 RepID=A0A518BWE9_9BACT|nr:DUF6786 family protein [Mucisphaera calidilacus]QDU71281.1 hypothetical protein Pan265_11300 [Mucisphaera calidilacus]